MRFDVTDKQALMELMEENMFEFSYSVGQQVKHMMQDEIKAQVYDAYTPVIYKRTYGLLNSVESDMQSNESDISLIVGINPMLMPVGSGEFKVRKTRIRKGKRLSKGNTTVVYGIHASNELHDERANIADYVFGGIGSTRPWGYNKNKKRVFVHSYRGRDGVDIITPVLENIYDIGDDVLVGMFGYGIDKKRLSVTIHEE